CTIPDWQSDGPYLGRRHDHSGCHLWMYCGCCSHFCSVVDRGAQNRVFPGVLNLFLRAALPAACRPSQSTSTARASNAASTGATIGAATIAADSRANRLSVLWTHAFAAGVTFCHNMTRSS